jgi:hypothetical protein
MADVAGTLRRALMELESEKSRIEGQIAAIMTVLGDGAGRRGRRAGGGRKPMSAAGRRAVSQRMKAYWAKRRATKAKAAGKSRAA